MTKSISFFITLFFVFNDSYCQEVTILQNDLYPHEKIQLFISNYDTTLRKIITHSSFFTDTSMVDNLSSFHIITLEAKKTGVYNLHLQFFGLNDQLLKENTTNIKVLEKSFISKYERILGPLIGAFIATIVFIINNYLTEYFQTRKIKNGFKLLVNSYIEKIKRYSGSEEYLNLLTLVLINNDNPLCLPYSDGKISQKADKIKDAIYDYRSQKIDLKTLIDKLETNVL